MRGFFTSLCVLVVLAASVPALAACVRGRYDPACYQAAVNVRAGCIARGLVPHAATYGVNLLASDFVCVPGCVTVKGAVADPAMAAALASPNAPVCGRGKWANVKPR